MTQPRQLSARSLFGSLVLIAVIVAGGAAAFAYTAGWFSPQRLTPGKMVYALTPPTGVPLGHRRNHAKGICFTGMFARRFLSPCRSRRPDRGLNR
jgi:catalase